MCIYWRQLLEMLFDIVLFYFIFLLRISDDHIRIFVLFMFSSLSSYNVISNFPKKLNNFNMLHISGYSKSTINLENIQYINLEIYIYFIYKYGRTIYNISWNWLWLVLWFRIFFQILYLRIKQNKVAGIQ